MNYQFLFYLLLAATGIAMGGWLYTLNELLNEHTRRLNAEEGADVGRRTLARYWEELNASRREISVLQGRLMREKAMRELHESTPTGVDNL